MKNYSSFRTRKKKCAEEKWRGYCPFFVLSRDTAGGVVTRRVWCAQQTRNSAPTTWALRTRHVFLGPRSRHQFCVKTWVSAKGITTWALGARPDSFWSQFTTRFEVATWLRLGLVGLGRDMNFMSRHGLDILRSLHQFEVAAWLSWGRQVLGHDMIFMSRQGVAWCEQDRRMAKLVRVRQSSRSRSNMRDMVLVSRPRFEVATWFAMFGVATSFFMSRQKGTGVMS